MKSNPGIISFTDALAADDLAQFAQRIESLGYDALWVPEFLGREPYLTALFVLLRTERIKVATGIANVYSHDAIVAAQARQTLAELSGGRFILGLGVSHAPMAKAHGLEWVPPARKMRAYLEEMEATRVQSPPPVEPAPIWISAHGPLLLKLAAERANGANTYLMPPPHTQKAREIVGADLQLNVVMPMVLSKDASVARTMGRKALSIYLPLPAYRERWVKWGFTPEDFEDGGSDHLIDSLVAWGDETAIRDRMDEHLSAGANQIEISALNPNGRGPDWKLLESLAP